MQWKEAATASHYQTAVAIKNTLSAGDVEEAAIGIEELIEALGRSEKRALRSQLERLMIHIIKWKIQSQKRSRSWLSTIKDARHQIEVIQEDTPSLTNNALLEMWPKCFQHAKTIAEAETGVSCWLETVTWDEVFEQDFDNRDVPF
ncbi:MAG TPA: DUF29 domain-containing protein [Thermodesulfovibrionia bacterium]|nr:DUF29 domain-containing protein [Thermodesulfovibrionia bacterium]